MNKQYKARSAFWDVALGNNSKLANLAKLAIDEAEKNSAQRTWVSLSDDEEQEAMDVCVAYGVEAAIGWINDTLKEKNT